MSLRKMVKRAVPEKIRGMLRAEPAVWSWHATESFSQEGEDLVVTKLFRLPRDDFQGFYVDVGAHHPYRYSNTFKLYRMGWRGINIDPRPGMRETFDLARPGDHNIEVGVGPTAGELTYFEFKQPELNGFDEQLALSRDGVNGCRITGRRQIPVRPLRDILNDQSVPAIHLLTVDVEGMDLVVLESNDWEKYRPWIVLTEDGELGTLDDKGRVSEITAFLQSKGYVLFGRLVMTLVFVEKTRLTSDAIGPIIDIRK